MFDANDLDGYGSPSTDTPPLGKLLTGRRRSFAIPVLLASTLLTSAIPARSSEPSSPAQPVASSWRENCDPGQVPVMPPANTNMTLFAFTPCARTLDINRKYNGLPHRTVFLDFILVDDEGNRYMRVHKLERDQKDNKQKARLSISFKSLPTPVPGGQNFAQDSGAFVWPGKASVKVGADTLTWTIAATRPNAAPTTETMSYGANSFSLTSADGYTRLTGELKTPGVGWVQTLEDTKGLDRWLYGVATYVVTGTYQGKQMRGMVLVENAWSDRAWEESQVIHGGHSVLYALTKYKDNSYEYGIFLCMGDQHGAYGRGAINVNSKGETTLKETELNLAMDPDDQAGPIKTQIWTFPYRKPWLYTAGPVANMWWRPADMAVAEPDGSPTGLGSRGQREVFAFGWGERMQELGDPRAVEWSLPLQETRSPGTCPQWPKRSR